MINLTVLTQLLGTAAPADAGGQMKIGDGSGTSFSNVLGTIIGDSAGPAEGAASPVTFGTAPGLTTLAAHPGSAAGEEAATINSTDALSGFDSLIARLLSSLNIISGKKFVPLDMVLQTPGLDADLRQALEESLGSLEGDSVLLVAEEDLRRLMVEGLSGLTGTAVPAILIAQKGNHGDVVMKAVELSAVRAQDVNSQLPAQQLEFSISLPLELLTDTIITNNEDETANESAGTAGDEIESPDEYYPLLNALALLESILSAKGVGQEDMPLEAGATAGADPVSAVEPTSAIPVPADMVESPSAGQPQKEIYRLLSTIQSLVDSLSAAGDGATDSAGLSPAGEEAARKDILLSLIKVVRQGIEDSHRTGEAGPARDALALAEKLSGFSRLGMEEKIGALRELAVRLAGSVTSRTPAADGETAAADTGRLNELLGQILAATGGLDAGSEITGNSTASAGPKVDRLHPAAESFLAGSPAQETQAAASEGATAGSGSAGQVAFGGTENLTAPEITVPDNTPEQMSSPATGQPVAQSAAAAENGSQPATAGDIARALEAAADLLLSFKGSITAAQQHSTNRKQAGESAGQTAAALGTETKSSLTFTSGIGKALTDGPTLTTVASSGRPADSPAVGNPGNESPISRVITGSPSGGKPEAAESAASQQQSSAAVSSSSLSTGSAPDNAKSVQIQDAVSRIVDSQTAVPAEGSRISVPVKLSSYLKKKEGAAGQAAVNRAAAEYSKLGSQTSSQKGGPTLAQAVGIAAGDLLEAVIGSGGDDKADGKTDRVESQAGPKSDQLQGAFRGELALVRDSAQKADSAGQARANWPLNQAEAFEKIINAARAVRTGFSSEISLKLEPDHLGLMRVRLSVDDNQGLNARIQVESNEARSLIENSLHRLRDSLAEQGLKVEKFSVDVRQNHNQESSQQHFSEPGRDGNGHSRGVGFADNDQNGNGAGQDGEISTAAADQKIEKLLKYSYSTLEWVA